MLPLWLARRANGRPEPARYGEGGVILSERDPVKELLCVCEQQRVIGQGRVEVDERQVTYTRLAGDARGVSGGRVLVGTERSAGGRPRLMEKMLDALRELGTCRLVRGVRD